MTPATKQSCMDNIRRTNGWKKKSGCKGKPFKESNTYHRIILRVATAEVYGSSSSLPNSAETYEMLNLEC